MAPTLTAIVAALDAHKVGSEWKALCPCHDDHNPSLSITEKNGKPVVKCRAGCEQSQVWAAVCAVVSGEASNGKVDVPIVHVRRVSTRAKASQAGAFEASYPYAGDDGREYVKHRCGRRESKRIWWDPAPQQGTALALYRDVSNAIEAGETVYLVEGEEDVHAIERAGCVATTSGGTGSWKEHHAHALRGAHIVVVQDRDDVGRKHARQVAQALTRTAATVRVVEALAGKDAADHLEAGHSFAEFRDVRLARSGAIDGASFILDTPSDIPSVWGRHREVAWAQGETLLIAGPQGVGKSTLLQQIALARIGIRSEPLLMMNVSLDARPALYVAADRPSQIQRSLARMVSESDRDALSSGLIVWQGPLPFNLATEHEKFAPFVNEFGVGSVFIDSLKDVAHDLSKDETGSRVNAALQETLGYGIEVVVSHHQRKAQANNKKPTTLSDVYGSTWITAGVGSVLLLWGQAGDAIVELLHLKQPAEEIGPLFLRHDHASGTTEVQPEFDLSITLSSEKGMTVKQAAQKLFSTEEPSRNQVEKARRKLESFVASSRATVIERERASGGKAERVYRIAGGLP